MEPFALWDWTALGWYLDVHVIDDHNASDLLRLGELHWVYLQVTDTAHLEASAAKDPDHRERLRAALAPFPAAMGPLVPDHSLFDMTVLGSDEDADRTAAVYDALWPNNIMADDAEQMTATGRTRYRDALHVATPIRYHGTGFVTEDQGIQRAAVRVAERFAGFRIVSIAAATAEAIAAARRVRATAARAGNPDPTRLHGWP